MFRSLYRWWTNAEPQEDVASKNPSNAVSPAGQPPLKRRRTSSEHHELVPRPQTYLVGPIWFPLGDVVVGALGSEEQVVMFRCYRWHLAQSSPVFMDLLFLPQPQLIEYVYGVPLVRILDKADDFYEVLRMIHDVNYYPCQKYDNDLARKILGPLKLIDKYRMNGLRVHLGEFLEGAWPTTLDGWDNKEADLEHLHPEAWSLSPKDAVKLFPDPISVIRLAEELHMGNILPAVLYELHRTYLLTLCSASATEVRGSAWTPQRRDATPAAIEHYPLSQETSLNAPELHRLLIGREFLRSRIVWFMTVHMDHVTSHNHHYRSRSCQPGIRRWWVDAMRREMGRQVIFRDPLKVYLELKEEVKMGSKNSICGECRRHLRRVFKAEREAIWKDLGKYFNVEKM